MAVSSYNYFTGAGDSTGNITTAGNWSLGHIPTSGEIGVINATAYDITGDNSATACDGYQITPGWRGKMIGTAATPVKVRCSVNGGVTNSTGNLDITVSANCELVHVGAGSNTIVKARAANVRQLVFNTGTFTDIEAYGCSSIVVAENTTVTNGRFEKCGNILYDTKGTATGPSLIYLNKSSHLTTKRAAASACATLIGPGCAVTVNDPGSLGASGTVLCFGMLTYRSSVAGPSVEIFGEGVVNENGSVFNVAFGTVRDWPESVFDDRPVGILVTTTTRTPVVKAS